MSNSEKTKQDNAASKVNEPDNSGEDKPAADESAYPNDDYWPAADEKGTVDPNGNGDSEKLKRKTISQ